MGGAIERVMIDKTYVVVLRGRGRERAWYIPGKHHSHRLDISMFSARDAYKRSIHRPRQLETVHQSRAPHKRAESVLVLFRAEKNDLRGLSHAESLKNPARGAILRSAILN
jgi:hypothetical protein